MIKLVKFDALDVQKYQKCLAEAAQNASFADLRYLKAINGKDWDFLIFNDYEAVMPVHFKNKFGFKFVILPPYINQIGIFSKSDDVGINRQFQEFLVKNYRISYYPFNYQNTGLELPYRLNFRVKKQDYDTISKGYSVHRRRNVRLRESGLKFVEITSFAEILDFYRENIIGMKSARMSRKYEAALYDFEQSGILKIYAIFRNDEPVSVAVIAVMPDEIGLLALVNDKEKITANDPSILIDQIIQKYCAERNINFFGSNIAAVAEFYRRFGAQEERYPFILNTRREVLRNFLKN